MQIFKVEGSNREGRRVYKIEKRYEAEIERSELRYSILQIILAIAMISIGAYYNDEEVCPNHAAWWLFIAGLILLVLNILNVANKVYRRCLLDHGKNSFVKRCGLEILLVSSALLTIADVVMIIWGAFLVFGSYDSWTYDLRKYEQNMEELNYCHYTPMMTAFAILIVKFILLPVMIIMLCICVCCVSCLCPSLTSQEPAQVIEIGQEKEAGETIAN